MYKVFIYDKPVYFTSDPEFEVKNCQQLTVVDVEKILADLVNETTPGIVVLTQDEKKAWKAFVRFFKSITAAGGVVENEEGHLLVIYRLGKWDLPKGKLEKGEDVKACAIREVEAECSVSGLEISGELPNTYHCYPHKKGWALKTTHWYRMRTANQGLLIPQEEEGIERVEWCPKDQIEKVMANTYQSIADVLANAGWGSK